MGLKWLFSSIIQQPLSKEVILIAFISSNRIFYRYYDNGTFDIITTTEVISILSKQFEFECFCGDICSLFKTSNYLVSPLNTPHKFLDKQYFLTNQQESIRLDIISKIEKTNESQVGLFFGLTGGPGTGKTLALYDLAFNTNSDDLVCIIHCGKLSLGHDYLKGTTPNINILPAKGIHNKNLSKYKYIFVDECHRIYIHQFEYIIDTVRKNHLICILSYDENQVLSRTEKKNEIVDRIRAIEGLNEYKLTNKIRTNKEIASFVQKLFYLNYKDRNTDNILNYPSISIVYANNTLEAEHFIAAYRNRGYVFINFTKSLYNKSPFDGFEEDFDTHHVIGQEFDLVAMLIDNTFYYDENDMLQSNVHPNPDYLYNQLLFQGLTRVREKLVIIVLDNMNFFEKLIKCISK